MKAFLTLQSVDTILRQYELFATLKAEDVPLAQAAGRCLAQAWRAPTPLPGFDRSTVDGFAVRARDIFGAQESAPALLSCVGDCPMGAAPNFALAPGQCARILTGGMLPEGADCVVMVEYSREAGTPMVEIIRTQAPGDNVILADDDAAQGAEILPAGKKLRPQEIGFLAAFGCANVTVHLRPRVAILSTGDEIVPMEQEPQPGQVRDVNSHSLAALCTAAGATVQLVGLIPDDVHKLRQSVREAMHTADVVLVSGGSSAGMRDHTVDVFTHIPDSTLLAHGAAISPGKPFILAKAGNACLMGLPGHVTSALVCARVFLIPLLQHLQGQCAPIPPTVPVQLTRAVAGAQGRRDYIRVRLSPLATVHNTAATAGANGVSAAAGANETISVNGRNISAPPAAPDMPQRNVLCAPHYAATPILGASGLLSGLVAADALIVCPENREGLYPGEIVHALLLD